MTVIITEPTDRPTKSDIIRAVNHSKSAEILLFNSMSSMTDRSRALKILNDAVQNGSIVIYLK